jgi:hypothetical protein
MRLTAFLFIIVMTSGLYAQLVVAAPGVETMVEKHSIMTMQTAFEEKIRQYKYYLEYVAQFTQVLKAINFTTSTFRNTYRAGKALKERSAKDWLNDAKTALHNASPEFGEMLAEIDELRGQGKAVKKGRFFDYVGKWDHQSLEFYDHLLENYEKHVMFPELFPLSSEAHGWDKRSGDAVVRKAWIESGMEQEMGDDAVRRRLFGQYYQEYARQAQENDNIEAIGISKLLQANYLISEDINHLRKNSDLEVMEAQHARDYLDAHERARTERHQEEMKKGKPKGRQTIFGL